MSGRIAAVATATLLAASCAPPPPPPSAPAQLSPVESCVVVGGPQAPADVRIYESNPNGSPAGRRLYIGTLNRGERHLIQTTTARFWYSFRWHEGDTWRDGREVPCAGRRQVELP